MFRDKYISEEFRQAAASTPGAKLFFHITGVFPDHSIQWQV